MSIPVLQQFDLYPPPTLASEVANTSLLDDKGEKRLLYEQLGVAEYWIVDVKNIEIFAFAVANGGTKRITQSQVLLGLEIAILLVRGFCLSFNNNSCCSAASLHKRAFANVETATSSDKLCLILF